MKEKESLSRKLFNAVFYLFSSSLVSLALKVLIVAYIARKLGVEQFGLYSAILSFVGLFQFLSDFGLNKSLLKFGSLDSENARVSFGNALFAKTFLVFPLLLFVSLSGYCFGYKNDELIVLVLFALSLVLESYASVFSSVRRILGHFELISFFRVLKTLITLIVIVLVLSKYNSVFALALVTVFLTAFMFVVSLINTLFLLKPKFKLSILGDFFKDSLIFSLNDFFLNIYTRINVVLLSFFSNLFSVGIYSAAVRFTTIASLLPRQVRFALLPTMYRILENQKSEGAINEQVFDSVSQGEIFDPSSSSPEIQQEGRSVSQKLIESNIERSKRVFNTILKLMILFAAPLSVAIWFLSDNIIHFIFGSKYDMSIPLVKLFSIFIFLRFIETPFSLFYFGLEKHKSLVTIQGITSLINVALCLIMIPGFAVFGAASATIISEAIFAFVLIFYGSRYLIWSTSVVFGLLFKHVFVVLAAMFFTMLVAASLHVFVQLFFLCALYVVFLFVIKEFTEDDKLLFKKLFSRGKA